MVVISRVGLMHPEVRWVGVDSCVSVSPLAEMPFLAKRLLPYPASLHHWCLVLTEIFFLSDYIQPHWPCQEVSCLRAYLFIHLANDGGHVCSISYSYQHPELCAVHGRSQCLLNAQWLSNHQEKANKQTKSALEMPGLPQTGCCNPVSGFHLSKIRLCF